MIVPDAPTATSSWEGAPPSPYSVTVVPLVWAFHALPVVWRTAPELPTAKTPEAASPQAARRLLEVPVARGVQTPETRRSEVPLRGHALGGGV